MAKAGTISFHVGGKDVPLDIYKEWRNSARITIGKKSLILRVPKVVSQEMLKSHIEWARKWVEKQLKKDPEALDRLINKKYDHGDLVHTALKTYELDIQTEQRKTNRGKVNGHLLQLKLNQDLDTEAVQQVTTNLIRRLIALDHTPQISRRVYELNDLYFQKTIRNIKLKYNTSNWGSCSSSGNINLSTRLLMAPLEVQDYVIIHELAHLIELNHSDKFWKIVSNVMPDYKEKEKWLKLNSGNCRI